MADKKVRVAQVRHSQPSDSQHIFNTFSSDGPLLPHTLPHTLSFSLPTKCENSSELARENKLSLESILAELDSYDSAPGWNKNSLARHLRHVGKENVHTYRPRCVTNRKIENGEKKIEKSVLI